MFWRKRFVAVNKVPDDYEFSQEYMITVEYKRGYHDDSPWVAYTDDLILYLARGNTKEEVTILAQNALYLYDLERRKVLANPPETFVIPPIRKFDDNGNL